jgi:transcription initiation factor TFIIIB Brf1 subunit/transcription initiation factor TFIIB
VGNIALKTIIETGDTAHNSESVQLEERSKIERNKKWQNPI